MYVAAKLSKMKFDFANFDFNSLPDFEPLEDTLVLIRDDMFNKPGYYKLLSIDTSELLDHPQWIELLDLLKRVLVMPKDDFLNTERVDVHILGIKVLSRFMTCQMNSYQIIDILHILMDYFVEVFLHFDRTNLVISRVIHRVL